MLRWDGKGRNLPLEFWCQGFQCLVSLFLYHFVTSSATALGITSPFSMANFCTIMYMYLFVLAETEG